jgi:hypothetical protein
MKSELDYKLVVEQCGGAEYVGRRGRVILFGDLETDSILSLYAEALTPHNIYLALKDSREKHHAIHEWQEVTANERG